MVGGMIVGLICFVGCDYSSTRSGGFFRGSKANADDSIDMPASARETPVIFQRVRQNLTAAPASIASIWRLSRGGERKAFAPLSTVIEEDKHLTMVSSTAPSEMLDSIPYSTRTGEYENSEIHNSTPYQTEWPNAIADLAASTFIEEDQNRMANAPDSTEEPWSDATAASTIIEEDQHPKISNGPGSTGMPGEKAASTFIEETQMVNTQDPKEKPEDLAPSPENNSTQR